MKGHKRNQFQVPQVIGFSLPQGSQDFRVVFQTRYLGRVLIKCYDD